jgi:ferredoxin
MWLQRRDVSFSAQGYAKALQLGASGMEMADELSACIHCAACDVLCPANIDLTAMIQSAQRQAKIADVSMAESVEDSFTVACNPLLLNHLGSDDFYIIEARIFHVHHAMRVGVYEKLRRVSGCSMNLDLHRMAIPTGIDSGADKSQSFDVHKQLQWLVQGRTFKRVVVENRADVSRLAEFTGLPVVHVQELIRSTS